MTDEPFVIDTLAKAAWAMRKYREAAQRVEINEGLAFSERTRISEWLEGVNKPFLDDMDFFAAHLEGFARKERAEGRKSVSVPDGVVQTRTKQPAFEIDKEAFIAWAKEHKPDLLRVTYAPDLKSMKANRLPITSPDRVAKDLRTAVESGEIAFTKGADLDSRYGIESAAACYAACVEHHKIP